MRHDGRDDLSYGMIRMAQCSCSDGTLHPIGSLGDHTASVHGRQRG